MAGWRLHRGGDCQQNAQKEAKGWEGYGLKDGFRGDSMKKEMCGMAQKKQTDIQTHDEMGGINISGQLTNKKGQQTANCALARDST